MAEEHQERQRAVSAFTETLQKAGIALSTAVENVTASGELSGAVIDVPATGLFGKKRNEGCNLNRGCTVNESCSG